MAVKDPICRILIGLLSVSSAGCSSGAQQTDGVVADSPKVFSAEDKRVARSLSVGGAGPKTTQSPQSQALACTVALASIADRMEQSGLLSADQQQAFEQARMQYEGRAKEGLPSAEFNERKKEAEIEYGDPGVRAQMAVGCLRDLA